MYEFCFTCKYFNEADDSDESWGCCRRRAPKIAPQYDIVRLTERHDADREEILDNWKHDMLLSAVFPCVQANDWCGEYEKK